jgi:hypothetical protein
VVGAAIKVARIAVGDVVEEVREPSGKVRSGLAGAKARAESMSSQQRSQIARKAAEARWK